MQFLIVGCGDVGLRLAGQLGAGPRRVRGLLRNPDPDKVANLRNAGVMPVTGDLDQRRSLYRLGGLADVVFHFAPPPSEGEHDPRSCRLLAALSRRSLPRSMIYVSTSGVYGNCHGAQVAETRPVSPQSARARRRVDAEKVLRRWAGKHGVKLMILRAPGIYAENRMPVERVRKGLPALLPEEDVYTNHIHADDLAGLARAALRKGRLNRIYHAVDDSGLKMGDWFDVVADHHNLPRPPRLTRDAVMAAVTPAMRTFLNESRQLSNHRLKVELGYRLRHPSARKVLPPHQPD